MGPLLRQPALDGRHGHGGGLAWLGLRSAPPESARGLRWMAIGLTAYATGQIIWDVQTAVGYSGFPSPSDLFYLWLGPCVAAGLLIEAFRLADRVQRKTLLLDAATLAIAALTLVLVLYLPRRGEMACCPWPCWWRIRWACLRRPASA